MRRLVALLLLSTSFVSFSAVAASAEEGAPGAPPIDWQKELREDIVVTKGKTLVIDDYGLLDFGSAPRRRLRVRWHAEAPAKSFISRDSFVAVFNAMQTSMMLTLVVGERQISRADLADFSYEPLVDNPTITADMEFRFVLTQDGIDIAVSTDGHPPTLRTMAWGELYKRRAASVTGALSMVPGRHPKLPPTCERYIKSFRACVAEIPEGARELVSESINSMERDWLAVDDKPSLEPACQSALDSARESMKAACPSVKW